MKKRIIECLATGFFFGKSPYMPGTVGTLWGVPLAWALRQGGPYFYMFGSVMVLFFAVLVAELYEGFSKAHDPGEVVIDEIVGYLLAAMWLPQTWQAFLAAFVAFRFFDIVKPFPIRQIDRKIHGGLGTVLDDVAAGLAANIVLQVIYNKTDWLGVMSDGSIG